MNTSIPEPTPGNGLKFWIKQNRRTARKKLSIWLARQRGTTQPRGEPLDRPPESILVCRVNKRLGNILFMTPLIRSLAETFPEASIDILVLDAAHRRLLTGLPGVRDVIHVSRNPSGLLKFIAQLRRRQYDLAIDPSYNAVSNRISISLCRARYKLGFANPEQWVRLTHAAEVPEGEEHQARQAVYLLGKGIPGIKATLLDRLEVRPDEDARAAAGETLTAALGGPKRGPVIGFFTNATGDKLLPAEWWQKWAGALQSSVTLLQILPPGVSEPVLPGIPFVSLGRLDQLAALIGLLDLFVAADSGPMHLAAASGTPTVGLFQTTNPSGYAPLGRDCLALSLDTGSNGTSAKKIAERTLGHLHKQSISKK